MPGCSSKWAHHHPWLVDEALIVRDRVKWCADRYQSLRNSYDECWQITTKLGQNPPLWWQQWPQLLSCHQHSCWCTWQTASPSNTETDNLQGPTCSQNGHSRQNDLGTCENECQRAVKERKDQPSAKGIKSLPCPVKTDENKSCSVKHSTKATMESCDSSHMVNTHDNRPWEYPY